MERKTLKSLRLLIPGLALILAFLPLFYQMGIEYKIGEGWLAYSLLIIPAFVLGAVYNMLDTRFFITNYSHRKIDLNITSSLLKIYNRELSQEQINFLKQKRLKHIFYNIVDNDASLTAKSQLVYSNGILWTSTADVFLISIFASIIYIGIGVPTENSSIWMTGILLAGIGLLSILFHILTIFRHFNLSNDQLEYIETHYVKTLKEKLDEILQ
ncbi:hypothetical protein QYS49_38625 [Marivirga salinae]|uniref:Uncharacterized protein n=1 Tax=Marivirga salinarum TaxID=3059078 RepID=A0AA51NA47_9BACT|nr:hypothetical protein [Marivirga sp. BDSF4-3]WMN11509.1 hypothetical protein QYS49_38625 [Marivirga sp. BDSF4-3]